MTIVRFYPTQDDAGLRQYILKEFGVRSTITQSFVEGHAEWEVAAAIPGQRDALRNLIDPEPDEITRGMSTQWDDD